MGIRLFLVALIVGLASFSFLLAAKNQDQILRSSSAKTMTDPKNRRLEQIDVDELSNFNPIAGYIPLSSVQDQNNIDLDQKALEHQLAKQNQASFENALRIYNEGAFSKSAAEITLLTPLDVRLWKGTPVIGMSQIGNRVDGKLYNNVFAGETAITVQYDSTDIEEEKCQVGANPEPILDGCLVSAGSLEIALNPGNLRAYPYTYDLEVSNVNKRTIQSFSTTAQNEMYRCPHCPLEMYQKFYQYYGVFDYANQVVLAAFEGKSTNFERMNDDFGLYEFNERAELIKTTTVFMIIWMKVIERMENAISKCQPGCALEGNGCNDDSINSWDEAVAYYTGSLEGPNGSGIGVLLYAEADRRCVDFKTCGENSNSLSGTSGVNIDAFRLFELGQSALGSGECGEARAFKAGIEQKMLVPLIQGTLRHAWAFSAELSSEVSWGKGAGYLFSILPIVHSCDPDAALTVVSNMQTLGATDFFAVKAALESTYDCLGIIPLEVGGLWDSTINYYFAGFEPKGFEDETPTPTSKQTQTPTPAPTPIPTPNPTSKQTQTPSDDSSQAHTKALTWIPTSEQTTKPIATTSAPVEEVPTQVEGAPTEVPHPIPAKVDEDLDLVGSGSPRLESGRLLTQTTLLLLVGFLVLYLL